MSGLDVLAARIAAAAAARDSPPHVVAIDGCGGAGKSTLATALAARLSDPPLVPTDHFASWEDQFGWWPRFLEEVLGPLTRGDRVRYRRYDWDRRRLDGWIALPEHPAIVVIEGVGAVRREFDPHLSFRIWVDAPPELRLRRGLERDGAAARPLWERWMAAEDEYVRQQDPRSRADAVVSGAE